MPSNMNNLLLQATRRFSQAIVINPIQPQNLKTYDQIPTNKTWFPSALCLLKAGGPGYLHEHCDRLHKQLGPIYRERLGPAELVFLADTKMIQAVVMNEGAHPHHSVPPVWEFYNKVKGVQRGLFFQTGESWLRQRKVFNKVMLSRSKMINDFDQGLAEINSQLFSTWTEKYRKIDGSLVINGLKGDLCKWSIESTCFMLFGRKLGCMATSNSDPRPSELVHSVERMFEETSNFQLLPVELAYKLNLPTWRRFEQATTSMIRIAHELTRENLERIQHKNGHDFPCLAKDLIATQDLDIEEVVRSLVDLIIAAADTTSNSLEWMLYLLAKHADCQAAIFTERRNQDKTQPYLKAFVNESHRLFPTAPFLARTLNKPIALGGYLVPAGKALVFSLYTTSRSETYFEEPLDFKPERWLRDVEGSSERRAKGAYASLPFGIGARMCVGRHLAQSQISQFLSMFVENFQSRLADEMQNEEARIKLKMILRPEKPIKLKIRPRESTKLRGGLKSKEVSN